LKILVTGSKGQVGWELARSCQPLGTVVAFDRSGIDLARPESIRDAVRSIQPDVILNAAAYTAVDAAEDDEENALRINGTAVEILAGEAHTLGALLVHYSTDYVLDGASERPYVESDSPAPLSAYGRSKLAGERALAASSASWLCLRTSWVYAPRGRNFFRTIVRLAGERDELRIVADQVGAPTSARLIADATAQVVAQAVRERRDGVFSPALFHLTASGSTSWHGFASRIVELLRVDPGATPLRVQQVLPITTADYPVRAVRPRNSRLECGAIERRFGLKMPDWSVGLANCVLDAR
jgi:dTDP-4-dehydrorhamnose reductase